MPDSDNKPTWWRELLRREAVGGHVVNAVVNLAVTFVAGLVVTICWVAWAAWRGSYLWTQRGIGAALAFAVVLIATAVALAILRRRLTPVGASLPVAPKGYLDHRVESDKASDEFVRVMGLFTKISSDSTKLTVAATARIKKINKLPFKEQTQKKLAESQRSAQSTDKTTKRMAAQIPRLEKAVNTVSRGNLAYLQWYTANHQMTPAEANEQIQLAHNRLSATKSWLEAQANLRATIEASRGRSQTLTEAVDRQLVVIDRMRDIMASQLAPLSEIIALLTPHTKAPSEITINPPSSSAT